MKNTARKKGSKIEFEAVTAKLFKNGNSQAVRLPKEFRFEGDEVLIHREGNKVIIEQKSQVKTKNKFWEDFFYNTPLVSEDFLADRGDTPPQQRDFF